MKNEAMKMIKKLCIQLCHDGKTHQAMDQSLEECHSYCRGKFYLHKEKWVFEFSTMH